MGLAFSNEKRVFRLCMFFFIILAGSFFNVIAAYMALIIGLIFIMFLSVREIYMFLLFFFSFGVVFKANSNSTSFFTYMEFLAIAIIIYKYRKISRKAFVVLLLLSAYILLVSADISAITNTVKIIVGLLLFYYFTVAYEEKDSGYYLSFYIVGIVLSSFIGFFKDSLPRLWSMYTELDYVWIGTNHVMRFSGIFQDPNYFSIAIILCLFTLLIGFLTEKRTWGIIFALGLCVIFGLATVSKSFLGMLAVVIAICLSSIKLDKKIWRALLLIIILLGGVIADPFNFISNILSRVDFNNITTGRTEIWETYLTTINLEFIKMLFGFGINAPYIGGRAVHNFYIEIVYYLGFIGSIIYFITLTFLVSCNRRKFRRKVINYGGFIVLLLMFMFLCGVERQELPFFLIISFIIFNNDFRNDEQLIYIS